MRHPLGTQGAGDQNKTRRAGPQSAGRTAYVLEMWVVQPLILQGYADMVGLLTLTRSGTVPIGRVIVKR